MIHQLTKAIGVAAALLAAGAPGLAAQSTTERGAFLVRTGSDTVVIEHFVRVGDTVRGSVSVKGQSRQDYVATLGPRFTIGKLDLSLFRGGTADTMPMQRIRIVMVGDSAIAEIGANVQRIGTTAGAVALLNNSFALGEQFTRRARAAGGTVEIPAWALAGGSTLMVSLRAVGADSMTLTVGGIEERLQVDAVGRILGGTIPSQRLEVIRVDGSVAAKLRLGKADTSPAVPMPSLPPGVIERAITVPGPVPLPGTLTLPSGKGPFRGVVLVHGSGAGDRDETVVGNKPFRDIAWGLAERGIAVLRYDKRSRVAPGWYATRGFTVYDETIQDALGALTLLRQQPEIDAAETFVLGHSLGGMVAPRIALADPRLAGVIVMAGATRIELPAQMERQYRYIASISGADSSAVMAEWKKLALAIDRVRKLTPADSSDIAPIPGLGGTSPRYWLDLAAHDPAVTMRKVAIPALVLQGMRDYQVPPDQLDDWLKVLGPHKDLTVKRYPSLTHLMIAGKGRPRPAEYAIPGHVDTVVIADIAKWIRGIKPRQAR